MNTLIFGCYNLHIVYSWWTLITDLISDPFFIGVQGSSDFRCGLYSVFQTLDLKFVNHLIFDIHFGLNKKALLILLKRVSGVRRLC